MGGERGRTGGVDEGGELDDEESKEEGRNDTGRI